VTTRRPTALVTGASRGVGKGIAVALAAAGYDVAITARTVHEGTAISPESGGVLPGSLDSTRADIEAHGARCVAIAMDLLDLDSLAPTVDDVFDAFDGRVDLVVNNAIYSGGGNDRRFGEVAPDDIVKRVTGNVTAQLLITHRALNLMLSSPSQRDHGGTFLNITSGAGQHTPAKVAGEGGWALVYAATKAGFHRIADMLALEYGDRGIRAINVNPGFVATERVLAAGAQLAFVASRGASPAMIGQACVAILADPTIENGAYVQAVDHFSRAGS
jgi:NAD(P)-dependent dehydrogenase (short-subunit alcohol dehydrogenase family)